MSHGSDSLANLSVSREVLAARGLVGVLLFVGKDRFELGLELGRDVDNEGWAHVVVERGVDDLEGTVRCKVAQAMYFEGVNVLRSGGVTQAAQSGEETCFIAYRSAGVMIGMAPGKLAGAAHESRVQF